MTGFSSNHYRLELIMAKQVTERAGSKSYEQFLGTLTNDPYLLERK